MECIPLEQLLAFSRNQLPADTAARVRTHLDHGCAVCHTWQQQLEKTVAATSSSQLSEPPEWLLRQARSLFAWTKMRSSPEPVKRTPAFLLFDSRTQGQCVGFRSVGSLARQVLYRAGDYNINLSLNCIEPAGVVDIMGQPIPLWTEMGMLAGADVEILRNEAIAAATKSNEFGAFILGGIPEGIYDLRIISEGEELDVLEFEAMVRPH